MDHWIFQRAAGQYVLDENFFSNYYTFLPDPLLSDNLRINVDAELSNSLCTAYRLLGHLEGMSAFLPNLAAIESVLMHKEALLSCQIDGIDAPLYSVIDISRKSDKITAPVKNYITAMQVGLDKLRGSKYKNGLLCEMHDVLMSADDSEGCGQFRTKHTFLGKYLATSNMFPDFNPTAPEHLLPALRDLEKFIYRNDDFDLLVKTALVHYQFETIHPFMEGNGRIGRILSYLVLSDRKILTRPLVCLSHYLNLNKVEYIDRMEALHRQRDYEQWIKFFIKSVIFAAGDSLERIKNWLYLRENNLAKIEQSGKSVKAIKPFYDAVERFPIFDVNTVAKEAGVSYNTGAAALKVLSDLQIVKQANHMTRNRDYAYVEFLNCFFGKDVLRQMDII